ncbi:MAG: L-threonylcarbamoyladenylate synthase [Halobacteriaceae archaeon]
MADVADAARAIQRGELVVYPTETVYGLGADALDSTAVERVFDAKGRPREKPISLGAPDVEAALDYVRAGDRERAFMRAFLPGPVTVVCERTAEVPDALTAGRDRVGVRVPDHDLAREFARRAGTPVTATSANESGTGSVRRVEDLSPAVRERVAAVLDGGETPGGGSTVVDVARDEIHRRGALADEVEAWLAEN